MGIWVQEQLVGTKDGVNQYFTVTKPPVAESMMVVHQGVRLVRVSGSPLGGETQYGIQNNIVIVGNPPGASDDIWVRYFNQVANFTTLDIFKAESLTITELSDLRRRPLQLTQFDSVTVSESPNLIFRRLLISANENITVSELSTIGEVPP